jgi:LytR cell envelope-related transcriptional attenuator
VSDLDAEPSEPDGAGRTRTGRAVVLLAVVVLIAVLVLERTGSPAVRPAVATATTQPTAAPATTTTTSGGAPEATTSTTAALIPPAQVTVAVLNGLQAGPLASGLSARLRADGYHTLTPDNTTTLTSDSAIYLTSGRYYPEAAKLVASLGLSAAAVPILRTIPATAPIPTGAATGADLVVVIGNSLQPLASSS